MDTTRIDHVTPTDDFSSPESRNVDHVAVVLEDSIDEIRQELSDAGVSIDREGTPRGAAGTAPAVYVRDPFGYRIELKATVHESNI